MGPALNLLLDSSTLIWLTSVPERLSASAQRAVADHDNVLFVSAASAWEIATKHRLGRLAHAGPLVEQMTIGLERVGYEPLVVTDRHALRAGSYDVAHADPFDRVIAAQAELEQMTIVASDRAFDLFPVSRLW